MPELPEVEVICRGLRPHLQGRTIKALRSSGKTLRRPIPLAPMQSRLCEAVVINVERRAKYLLFATDRGDILVIHLGMTGRLGLFDRNHPPTPHDHLCLLLDNNMELRFNDTRRFGAMHLLMAEKLPDAEREFFRATGPEPFSDSCSPSYLQKRAKGRRLAVKSFIMDSGIIAGVGNIYANESLFCAGIHPSTPAGSLTRNQWQRLITEIRLILNWAIDCGGSTIRDFLNASGRAGYFQANFRIYGRNGHPCATCSAQLERLVIGGRASFFCPHCQPLQK